jgi:3-dehydroquinate dehydratase
MKKSLSSIKAPAAAGVVRERTVAEAIAEINNCLYHGADMIDLHMEVLDDSSVEALKRIVNSTPLPILALNYNCNYDWSSKGLSEEERIEYFYRAIEAGAAGIDIQGYTFHADSKHKFCGEDKYSFTKGNPKEIVTDENIIAKQCELIERAHAAGVEVLHSCHPAVPMNTEQIMDLIAFLEKKNPDIIKIVSIADTEEQLYEAIKTMAEIKLKVKTPVSFHAGGKFGAPTRIINPIIGGQIAFCVDRYKAGSTMGQLDLETVRSIVDGTRKIF